MHTVTKKEDNSRKATVKVDPTKVRRGHLVLSGAGKHTDKRLRRSTRKSRNAAACAEW